MKLQGKQAMRNVRLGMEHVNQQCHLVIEFTCFLCLERVSAISIIKCPTHKIVSNDARESIRNRVI